MWWIGLIAGIGLVLFGAWKRWKVESAAEGKGPEFVWSDVLIVAGIGVALRTVKHEMLEETGREWVSAGLLGLAMAVAGLMMRTGGRKLGWSWRYGPAKNSTRTGRALILLGGMFLLGGVVGILNAIRFG